MQLVDIKEYEVVLTVKSGLHIGAGDGDLRIGGTSNSVVRNLRTREPYIPGSSLKGKMRSLLELKSGLIGEEGAPLGIRDYEKTPTEKKEECLDLLRLFGSIADNEESEVMIGPTRLTIPDACLEETWKKQMQQDGLGFTEVKAETAVDRITGTALNKTFRETERVVEGARFSVKIRLKVFSGDRDLEPLLLTGMRLVEMDALGGSGSRGYGRISFTFADKKIQDSYEKTVPFPEEAA